MSVPRLATLVAATLALATPVQAQDAADTAWTTGNVAVADSLYTLRLARDSTDDRALHRLALLRGWAKRYDESLVLFDRLLALTPTNIEAIVDRARVLAWRGELHGAIEVLEGVIAEHPTYLPALRSRAQFAAWAGETRDALATYEQILTITPDDRTVHRDQARTLTWAARHTEAIAIYDSLIRSDPTDQDALLGLARVLSWTNRLDSAAALYERVLQQTPDRIEALRGKARTLSWRGALADGERAWRVALEVVPDDVESLIGLGQTLRWQGRHGEALAVLERAAALDPNNSDVQTQIRWTRTVLDARVGVVVTSESDSDGNRIVTTLVRAAWRPATHIEVRMDAYTRQAGLEDPGPPDRAARGLAASVWGQFRNGWSATGGLGVSGSTAPAGSLIGTFRADIASPRRFRYGGTLAFVRSAYDYTAPMIERTVVVEEWSVSGRAQPHAGLLLTSRLSTAGYQGTASNRRLEWRGSVAQRLGRPWTVGVAARAFGFRDDVNDGYFDPDFYGLLEATGRWRREGRRWNLQAEVAPGVQQVNSGGTVRATVRASGRAGYLLSPGRELALALLFSSTGLQSFSTADADYRYRAVTLSLSWLF